MVLTLEWACGFEQFGNPTDLDQITQPWIAQVLDPNYHMSLSTTSGVRSLQGAGVTAQALNIGNYPDCGVLWTVPNVGTRFLGMGWYLPQMPAAESNLFLFTATPAAPNGTGSDGVRITLDNAGTVRLRQNATNTVLATSDTYAVSVNTQYWLSVSCNPNAGWVTMALNGTIIATAVLGITFPQKFITFASASGVGITIDDLVSYTSDGTDTAATLVPPRSVWTSLPNAIGDVTQWSRVGGAVANWASVNGQTYQTATYNTTSQTGAADFYNVTDLPGAPTTIDGVVVTACARKEDSGARGLKLHARVNGVDDVSAPVALTASASFWYLSATFPLAPNGSAWTASGVNLCQIGLEAV